MATKPYYLHGPAFNATVAGTADRIDSTPEGFAITFKSNGGSARKVALFIDRKIGSAVADYWVQIRSCNQTLGSPLSKTTNVLKSVAPTHNSMVTSKWNTFTFPSNLTLNAGSVYALCIEGKTSESASVYIVPRSLTNYTSALPNVFSTATHNYWKTTNNGLSWTKQNRRAPYFILDENDNYIDGFAHESGDANTTLYLNSVMSVGLKIKFSRPVTATNIGLNICWASGLNDPESYVYYKIYNSSGTLLSSANFKKPGSGAGGANFFSTPIANTIGVATVLSFSTANFYYFLFRTWETTGFKYKVFATRSFVGTAVPVQASTLFKYSVWGTTEAYAISTNTGKVENLWGSGSFKEYNNNTLGYWSLPLRLGYHQIEGQIKDQLNRPAPGNKVTNTQNGEIVGSAFTNQSGNYSLYNFRKGSYKLTPSYNDWDYAPDYKSGTTFNISTANFYQSSESKWWNEGYGSTSAGRHFAFRNKIIFSTPHSVIPFGYVATVGFQTGFQKVIATDGWFNESIDGHGQIDYSEGYTYFVFRTKAAKAKLVQYNRVTNEYLSTTFNTLSWTDMDAEYPTNPDTHYVPVVKVDNNGYIYVFISPHNQPTIRRYRSDLPHDISTWTRTSFTIDEIGGNPNWDPRVTYLRPRLNPLDKKIYVFFRGGIGYVNYNKSTQGFFVQTAIGSTSFSMGKFYAVDYYSDNVKPRSIYSFGNQFDKNGYCYSLCNYVYGYGLDPALRWDYSLNFYYSPDMKNWYNINGTKVGESTNNAYSDNSVMCCTSDGQLWRVTTLGYSESTAVRGGNSESLSISPYTWNNGTHNIYLPFLALASTNNDVGGPVSLCSHYYNTSLSKWQHYNISKATGIMGVFGHITSMVKPNGEYNIFAIVSTSNYQMKNYENFGCDLVRFYCTALLPNSNWRYQIIDSNNTYGNGNLCLKTPPFSNNEIELIYARGNDIIYHFDKSNYGYLRQDGNDLRIIYKGNEIPRYSDYFNNLDSKIYFKIQKTVTAGAIFDTAGNYYIYYGNQSTTQGGLSSSNPKQIYSFFENFETYNNKYILDDCPSWVKVVQAGSSTYGTFKVFTHTVDGVNIGANTIWPSWYNAYSGLKFCSMGDPSNATTSTVYLQTSIGAGSTDMVLRAEIKRLINEQNKYSFVGFKTEQNSVYAIGKTSRIPGGFSDRYPIYAYYNNSTWTRTGSTAGGYEGYQATMKMDISSVNGITFYRYDNDGNEFIFGTIPSVRYFKYLIFGGNTSGHQNLTYFDYIRMSKKIG